MFTVKQPSPEQIQSILERHRDAPFSYAEVGCSHHGDLPSGYNIDRHLVKLGAGQSVFAAAKRALQRWTMFDMPWLRLIPKDAEVQEGSVVAVVVSHLGFYSVNVSRIVYVTESEGLASSYCFAYGTLREHAEMGEERFTISWNRSDDSVSYEVLAFSKPRATLARIGYPLSRRLQKRFARASLAAMARSVSAA